jgi:hypothetical protein
MFKLFPGKTPFQMRREAERRANPEPKAQPPGKIDPSQFPPLSADGDDAAEAANDWLAHTCPEPVEGSPPAALRRNDPRHREH